MKRQSPRLLILTLVFALVPAAVHAGPTWSLDFTFGSNALVSDSGRSLLLFKPENSSSSAKSATEVVSLLNVDTTARAAHPDRVSNQLYLMVLRLTDLASHQSRSFWFVGDLNGKVSLSSADLTNRMLTKSSLTGIRLGNNVYNLSFGPFIDPNMAKHKSGEFEAKVSYQPIPKSGSQPTPLVAMAFAGPMSGSAHIGNVNESPEPSSAVLLALGISGAGIYAWRRQRKQPTASVSI